MDISDHDLLNFWRTLNDHAVRYIMVGGFATRFHGFNRATDDLDIWLDDTLLNRQNLRKSFAAVSYGDFPQIETMEFIPGWTSFHIGNSIEIDIMTDMKGLADYTFAQCLELASTANLDGVIVPFLHINQLILNKKTVGRPKDQIDVIELEKIKKIRAEGK